MFCSVKRGSALPTPEVVVTIQWDHLGVLLDLEPPVSGLMKVPDGRSCVRSHRQSSGPSAEM